MSNQKSEKVKRLNTYLNIVKGLLSNPTPAKHEDHPETYRQYLEGEVKLTEMAIKKLSDKDL